MMEQKVALFLPKIAPKLATHFYIIVTSLEIVQKSPNYLGPFCETICCKELVKIAPSGHTE